MAEDNIIYDFVFVGSGMGSLVCANLLAKEGHSVLILEKNPQLGGSLQTFSRDKRIFDTGVHYIGSLDEGENLNMIFRYLGITEKLQLKKLDENNFDLIRLPNKVEIPLAQGYDKFKSQLINQFPEEEAAIITFCEKVIDVCNYFPLYNLESSSKKNYLDSPEVLELEAWSYVCSITKNENLRCAFLGNGPLYAGEKDITPFYVLALILNSYITGSYRIVNGGGQLTKAFVKTLRTFDVEIKKRQEVIGAEFENNEIKSVITKEGDRFYGKNFISNLHPQLTIELFGEQHFRPALKNRINKLKNTIACFSLYISFKENSFPYLNYNVYDYFTDLSEIWSTAKYDKATWPQGYFACTPVNSKSDKYADSLSVLTYMNYEEVAQWEDTFNTVGQPSERGTSYEAFKREKEKKVIERLKERFPGIEDSIKNVYSSTPLTYKNYIGTKDGSLYGIRKNAKKPMSSVINSRTKIPNLYLTGQNLIFHGILGATIGGLVTSFNFIDKEQTLNKIKNL
jgi:all-trans-retinol 13,14-reductase